ncbi:kelch-like ECH-associated protein 1B isoform X2 [Anopheles aquasalis]|uniref:kelch-like ECH-associated protein 1B isoform X2 n=1 Tax=Anopheles aquasalis TaxID=42839 RepID=UPI00215A9C8F|nr:kelch-like ECH-associated protein 1B isoform X2 [Anopheles aquasalis]
MCGERWPVAANVTPLVNVQFVYMRPLADWPSSRTDDDTISIMEAAASGYADCFGNGGNGPGLMDVHSLSAGPAGAIPLGSASGVAGGADTGSNNGSTAPKEDLGDMTFFMPNFSREVLKMMFMMRSHHMLTDVALEVEQETFNAHKVVLSAASPYFKAMFTGGLKECEMERVKLQGVCPTAMARILFFMYTGHIRVTELTVCQLLPAATMFQVPSVIDACCEFLERQLDPTNAIGIANFAEQHGCEKLRQKANQFIERNFTQICREEEFLQLSVIQLICLIRKDELNVQGERDVYDAVLKWVKYDEDNRYPRMEHILSAVRCQLLTPSFLKEQMKNCEVLRKAPGCREYLAKIFQDLTLHKRPAVRERKPNTTRMIFVAGGYYKHSLDMLEGYNVDDKVWLTLPKLTVPRSGLGAAFLKGTFYAVGGRNNSPGSSYDSDWVDRYNPVTETWRPCSPMSVPRNRVGVVVMDELLYAVGGSSGSEYHNTVEYYDPETDRWTLVQPMQSKRLGVGVAVVNRLLYAIGGFDGKTRLATVECYHPENNAWTLVPPMRYGRSGAGVAALHQYIYVVGGFDGTRQLATVERYDTEQQCWEMVAPVRIARSALSLTVLDGRLYAIGGYDGQDFLTIVEVYDPVRDVWDEGTPLTSGRSGHASAVIYTPSCISSYMEGLNLCEDKRNDRSTGGAASGGGGAAPPGSSSSGASRGNGGDGGGRSTSSNHAGSSGGSGGGGSMVSDGGGTVDHRPGGGGGTSDANVLEEEDRQQFAMDTDSSQEECDKEGDEKGLASSQHRTTVPIEGAPPPEVLISLSTRAQHSPPLPVLPPPSSPPQVPSSMGRLNRSLSLLNGGGEPVTVRQCGLARRVLSCRKSKKDPSKPAKGNHKRSSSSVSCSKTTVSVTGSLGIGTAGGGCKSKRKASLNGGLPTDDDDHCPLVRLKKRLTCFMSAIVSPSSSSNNTANSPTTLPPLAIDPMAVDAREASLLSQSQPEEERCHDGSDNGSTTTGVPLSLSSKL